jgi:hypothetical protein
LSESEPIAFRPRTERDSRSRPGGSASGTPQAPEQAPAAQVAFNRQELSAILDLYGRRVSAGEWRDYAMDFGRERAVFSVFRRASEVPLYRIEKNPKLARKQGAYAVVSASGHILKRGHDLKRVLAVLDPRMHVVG